MRIVVALGGNALLPKGEAQSMENQQKAIATAARALADALYAGHHLLVIHGNGPRAAPADGAMPLEIPGAQSGGWIGYMLELALRNAFPEGAAVVSVLTQTLVAANDPAFANPKKPVGPLYDEAAARRLEALKNWPMAQEADGWRRVVPTPRPLGIVEILVLKRLLNTGVTVLCADGGGIPVCAGADGELAGVEAVVDKDLTSAMLARQVEADFFVMLTDVPGVYMDFGGKEQRIIACGDPGSMLAHACPLAAGSMRPKVEAACAFVQEARRPAAIGGLADLSEIIAGRRGTQIWPEGGRISFHYPEILDLRPASLGGSTTVMYL